MFFKGDKEKKKKNKGNHIFLFLNARKRCQSIANKKKGNHKKQLDQILEKKKALTTLHH